MLAQRAQIGETKLLEHAQQVSILAAALTGFYEMVSSKSDQETAQILQELTIDLEEAANRQGMERFSSIGQQWLGICGLTRPHLDHSRRAVEVALATQQIIQRLNQKHNVKLQLVAGIDAGVVTATAIGSNQIATELWGKTVGTSTKLRDEASPNTILVSQDIYDVLQEQYRFRRYDKAVPNAKQAAVWVLEGMKT